MRKFGTRGSRRRIVLLVVTAIIVGWMPLVSQSAKAATAKPRREQQQQAQGLSSLADCVRSGRGVLVVFLIDESGSLKQTDPSNQRVVAVKGALDGLASLESLATSPRRAGIQVQLDGFSVGFDTVGSWISLGTSTLQKVKSQADGFATRNTGQDTDYFAALDGARQALADRAAATQPSASQPCRAILWFTDGRYDVIDRVTPQQVAALGATKPYAPDVRLDVAGGGSQLIARGQQLLCEPGGLVDRLRSEEVVTISVALDTQITLGDQAFLTAVATGQGCGSSSSSPTGASVATSDLGTLVQTFDEVANRAAGGTPLGKPASVAACPGRPCAAGSRDFHVDRGLQRFHALVTTGAADVSVLVRGPRGETTLRFAANRAGTAHVGATTLRFVWIDGHTCSVDALLGGDAVGTWSIVLLAAGAHVTLAPGYVQLHVFGDVTPRIAPTPVIAVGQPTRFAVDLTTSAGNLISRDAFRNVTLNAIGINPITGQQLAIPVRGATEGHFRLTFPVARELPSVMVIQLTIVVVTIDGIRLVPIQRSYRVPVRLPPTFPHLTRPELNLRTPQGTAGGLALTMVGGTKPSCAWIDARPANAQTPGTQITYTGTDTQSKCLKLRVGQHRTLDVTATPSSATPGTIHTSIVLNIVIVHVHVTLLIPVVFTITSTALPTSSSATQRVAALGDSYSSGEGNPPFDIGTATLLDTCHRSPHAWPRLLGVSPELLLACSGAKTDALFHGQLAAAPDDVGQIDRLRQLNDAAPVDVVTLTIGGNDIDFSGILARCFLQVSGACLKDLPGAQRAVDRATTTIEHDVVPALRGAAPNARLLLVGYPRLFPSDYGQVHGCGWLSKSEHDKALQLQRYLTNKEAAAARAAGIGFVDVTDALNQHELCSSRSWVRPVTAHCGVALLPGGAGVDSASSACGHPTEAGQHAIAEQVRAAIEGTCLDEGALIATSTGITARYHCAARTVLAGQGVNLAQSDSAGGIIFQRQAAASDSGLPTSPIERVRPDGRIETVVAQPYDGAVQLETVASGAQGPIVVYSAAGRVSLDNNGDRSYPLAVRAKTLSTGRTVTLDSAIETPSTESPFVAQVGSGANRYLLAFSSDGYIALEARDAHAQKVALPTNIVDRTTATQPQGSPSAVALSPDGNQLATVEAIDDTGSSWDLVIRALPTGTEVHRISVPSGEIANRLTFDGQRALISFNGAAAGEASALPALIVNVTTGARKYLAEPGTATLGTSSAPPVVRTAPGLTTRQLAPFVENWFAHVGEITIAATGQGQLQYRNYRLCSDDPTPPCETHTSGLETFGNVTETFTITAVQGRTASGHFDTSNDAEADKPGTPLTLTLGANDQIEISSPGLQLADQTLPPHTFAFCGPRAPAGQCGA